MHSLDLRYYVTIMRTFFRLLLSLSITVVSFQGSAAMAIGQPEQAAHEMVAVTDHEHHQAVEQTGEEHCSEAGSKTATLSHAKCPVCANCCVGAAAPPALPPTFHAPPLTSSLHALAEVSKTSFVPSTLERPPRRDFV
jgi:hypothetical protein